MKKAFLVFFLFVGLHASQPAFPVLKIENAVHVSATNSKPIIFVVATTTCGHCINYLNSISDDVRLNNKIQTSFVFSLSLIDQGDTLPKALPFRGITPTTYIIRNGRSIVQPLEGELHPNDLLNLLNTIK